MEKVIFLLDLDGTLQGDVGPEVHEYEFIKKINSVLLGKKIKYNSEYLYNDMDNGLIRPYMVETIKNILEQHTNIEFFIYTASSDVWGNFIAKHICKKYFSSNQRVNQDIIFTRKHCILHNMNGMLTYKKSIKNVRPMIMRSLKNKYGNNIKNPDIYLIDNNFVLIGQERSKLIKCPTYNYRVVVNPMRNLTYPQINKFRTWLSKYFRLPPKEFVKAYNKRLHDEYSENKTNNKKEKLDKYWKKFNIIMKNGDFTSRGKVLETIHKLKRI